MNRTYQIAGHCFLVSGEKLCVAVGCIEGFKPFEAPDGEVDFFFREGSSEDIPPVVEVQYTFQYEDVTGTFIRTAGGYRLRLKPTDEDDFELWCCRDSREVWLCGNWALRLYRFALWVGYGLMTLFSGTLAIHSSCIVYRDKAVLFLGESGTGKSTHTRLWRENIEGAVLLNDDSPILRIIDGKPWMYGSPWSGKTPCYKQESYPLAACVRLSQAPYNKIQRLSIPQAYAALHPSCPPDFAYDDTLYDCISETIGEVLAQIPLYHLACLPNAEAAQLSCKTVFGE